MSARPYAESQIEYLAWFRFPVTWNYISGPALESASVVARKPLPAAPSLTLAPILPASLSRSAVAPDVVGTEDGAHAAGSAARWEMMVPKMARPPARSVPTLTVPAAAAPALPAPTAKPAPIIPPPIPASAKTAAVSLPIQFATPSFSLHTPEDQFVARYWPQILFALLAVVAIGCMIWGLSGHSTAAHSAASSAVSSANWSRQVSPAGRSLTLYEPSRAASDYRMEFSWVPNAAGVSWVFRTRDPNNYYATRLSLQPRGAENVLVAEHFGVLQGTENAHSRKVIPLQNAAAHSAASQNTAAQNTTAQNTTGLIKVHMDAIGSTFKLFVDDNLADSWTGTRFNSGALGFFDDGGRLPNLLALSVTFIDHSVSRTSVVPLP